MLGVLPMASGGIHVWHMPALTEIFGDDFFFFSSLYMSSKKG
ncbi:unnamed protein product [Musa acuminata subsp. malaccensis]|uniref:(wild Malaysian banana) hypothetical protein n=1 Tax=Musa acuminata subsp. malaccensis TaxID=214687 RepID=A0A8D7A1R9_MUSAM|nr:unnamed protein product [Musa acuminata subsp. malaccensis]